MAKVGTSLVTPSQFYNRKTENMECTGQVIREFIKKNRDKGVAVIIMMKILKNS